jgi:molybdopterin converting factor small subunit
MKIVMHALMKDYFDPEIQVEESVLNIDELKQILLQRNAGVENVLGVCRFAVNDWFIDNSFQLQANDVVSIIPPSSGG